MSLVSLVQATIGGIVWVLANLVYIRLRRKGARGFGRFAAFVAGQPTTWISLFLVTEGHVPLVEPEPDDEDRLFREVRVDRELRVDRGPRSKGGRQVGPEAAGSDGPRARALD
jgi:hypothetical protein